MSNTDISIVDIVVKGKNRANKDYGEIEARRRSSSGEVWNRKALA